MELNLLSFEIRYFIHFVLFFNNPVLISRALFILFKFNLNFLSSSRVDIIKSDVCKFSNASKVRSKKSFGLKGVMSIFAPILQIASLPKGQTVGYGKTFKTKRSIKVATIDFGYSDGYLRSGSSRAKVYIDGKPCDVVGRVSMALITIDVSHIDQNSLYLGKPVEILGNNQSCEDLALETGTNEHEILISLGRNSKKVYI